MKNAKREFVFLRWKFLQKIFSLHFYCVLTLCLAIEVVFYHHIVYCSTYRTISSCKLNIHTYIHTYMHRALKKKKVQYIHGSCKFPHTWLTHHLSNVSRWLPPKCQPNETNKQTNFCQPKPTLLSKKIKDYNIPN